MLISIVTLLLNTLVVIVAGSCLLRLYMQHQGISLSARNPMGPFLLAVSNGLVLPLRRVIPAVGRWDMASLIAAYAVIWLKFMLLGVWGHGSIYWLFILVISVTDLLQMVLNGALYLVIIYVIMSWGQSQSALYDVLERLVAPLLSPLRRHLPLMGQIDLSPLALLLIVNILEIVLNGLKFQALAMI
jgi:YggT family protein